VVSLIALVVLRKEDFVASGSPLLAPAGAVLATAA